MTPLGRYTEIAALIIALGVVAAAVVAHLVGVPDTSFVDDVALICVGAIFGAKSAANGYAASVVAAHHRLDAVGAPPADSLHP